MERREAIRRRTTLIGQLLVLAGIFESVVSETLEICVAEELRISCPTNTIIQTTSAEFGRMEVGRCIKKQDEFLGCTNDVLLLLDRWCSGRRECNFMVTNDDLEAANKNCMEILMKYLKVDYTCLSVQAMCSSSRPNTITDEDGFISSSTVDKKRCGSSTSPWIISASPGQTIELDIVDFSSSQQGYSLISCRSLYGFVLERTLGINYTICGGHSRERALYTSKTNSVEIVLLSKEKRNNANFLIHYSVAGCSEVIPPAHAWYKREGNEAVIGCDNSDKEWRLVCNHNTWVGDVGNCTQTVAVLKEETTYQEAFHISSIVVISGIAGAAIVLSVIAVVMGVVYINRYRMRQELKRANLCKTYSTMGSNAPTYYRPVIGDQSGNSDACWDMPLPPNQMALLSDKCTCPTLQMRNQGDVDKTERERSIERQSLYSSIKST